MKKGIILPNKIVVKENDPEEKKTETGIIIPKTRKNNTNSGVVTLVGDQCTTIKEGMTVLYTPLSAVRFSVDNEELALLAESAVLFAFWS